MITHMAKPRGFQKGNKLGIIASKVREKNKQDLWALIAGDHRDSYNELLEALRDDKQLSKEQKEFMDRVERLFPYTKAKKTEETVIIEDKRILLD